MTQFSSSILSQAESPTAQPTILLLEDDPVDRSLITANLSHSSIQNQLTYVVRRQEFIDRLNQTAPDLILSDYYLPDFNGMEALTLAKSICPDVPFILISGVLGEERAIEALKAGATDYVLKQRLEYLASAVNRALQESQERQERQRLAKNLKKTDQLLRTIVDASPAGIVLLSCDQRVMTWNTMAETFYGWTADAVLDRPFGLIPAAQQQVFEQCFAQALQGEVVVNQDFQHLKQDGTLVDVSLSFSRLMSESGNTVDGVVMIIVDNTAHKQLEAQRLRLLDQEQTARTAAEAASRIKDEFLATVSHELRTPLNAIIGWSALLKRNTTSNLAMFQSALETINRNAIAEAQLVEDLLDIAHILRGQLSLRLRPVDVVATIQTAYKSLCSAAEAKSIQVELALPTDLDLILADPLRLQQIVWNLLSNAIKFTPSSGRVKIQCDRIESDLRVCVTDTGMGISPDFIPYVFDYFRQEDGSTTRSQGGLGLGLAITRHLVELHGGTIQATSSGSGQGATFTFLIPLREMLPDPHKDHNETDLQDIKVLVVDDDTDSRQLINFVLEQQGATVESASNVQDALTTLVSFRPQVLISDIGMPGEDGYLLLQALRSLPDQDLRNTPAIALTAFAGEETRDRALAAGYQTYLTKPVDLEEVVQVTHQLVINRA